MQIRRWVSNSCGLANVTIFPLGLGIPFHPSLDCLDPAAFHLGLGRIGEGIVHADGSRTGVRHVDLGDRASGLGGLDGHFDAGPEDTAVAARKARQRTKERFRPAGPRGTNGM